MLVPPIYLKYIKYYITHSLGDLGDKFYFHEAFSRNHCCATTCEPGVCGDSGAGRLCGWNGYEWEEEPGGQVTLSFLCVFSNGFQDGFKELFAHDLHCNSV